MKAILFILTVLASLTMFGQQDITGQWNGSLTVQGNQLRVVFNISKTVNGYSSTMDSPDQGAKGIPVTSTTFENSILKIEISNAKLEYIGEFKDSSFVGTLKQSGYSFPMNLSREKIERKTIVRPQEPTKPYPYYSENVSFQNVKDKIILAGTLTLPKKDGKFPVVILITGSGPQNRDEEIFGHKPFLVIDYLSRNGIAVLRFDDRGTGESTGAFNKATTLDFASDVESAIEYLKTRKEINKNKIGLIGHSEGGIIAPMVAVNRQDVSFIILLAGLGIPGDKLLLLQQELILKASGDTDEQIQKTTILNKGAYEIVIKSNDSETLKINLTNYYNKTIDSIKYELPEGMSKDDFTKLAVAQLITPWFQYFIKYNPAIVLEKVKCPVLALNGEKDLQVPPKENLNAIKNDLAKGGNKNVTTKELPNLNHLFQDCKTGLPSEYSLIEETFSPTALNEITTWINKQLK